MYQVSASVVSLLLLALAVNACAPGPSTPTDRSISPTASFTLSSSAFGNGGSIPQRFTCAGQSISPELKWSGAPAGTKSLTLFVEDPDAPAGTFTHWVVFDIPAAQNEIAEAAQAVGKNGKNGAGRTGYTGPCPPSGTHRYFFTLTALDVESLGLSDGVSRAEVERAMGGHILAQTQIMGRYSK